MIHRFLTVKVKQTRCCYSTWTSCAHGCSFLLYSHFRQVETYIDCTMKLAASDMTELQTCFLLVKN